MKNFTYTLLLLLLLLPIRVLADSTLVDGKTYNIVSLISKTVVSSQEGKVTSVSQSASNDAHAVWTVEKLSGSIRLINVADGRALRADQTVELAEKNGSDEAQLWKLETAAGGAIVLVPSNSPQKMLVCGAEGAMTLTAKNLADKKGQFSFNPIATSTTETSVSQAGHTNNYWENETIFAENKEVGHALFMPYATESALTSDLTYYSKPWTEPSKAQYLKLNGTWKFKLVDEPSKRPMDFYKEGFDVSSWDDIQVPLSWEMAGYDRPIYCNVEYPHSNTPPYINARKGFNDNGNNYGINPVGSYVRKFTLPDNWEQSGATYIHFGGIYSAAFVYVNGQYAGYSQGSNNVAEFDISKYVRKGENTVAVQVFRWCDGSYLECQDMFRMSGIHRDVYLYHTPATAVRDYYITCDLKKETYYRSGRMDMALTLDNRAKADGEKNILVKVYDDMGSLVGKAAVRIPYTSSQTESTGKVSIELDNVALWTAETPNLYTVHVVQQNAQKKDEMAFSVKYGFRQIELNANGFFINGQRVLLKGVNRHDTDPVRGRAVTNDDMMKDIVMMKQHNINAVRTSHYPSAEQMYAMYDYYGLYVIDEADLEDHANQSISDKSSWSPAFNDRISRMVLRDRNHASVVMWSLGNEAGGGSNFDGCYNTARSLDTRPIHYEGTRDGKPYGGNRFSDVYSKMYPGMNWMNTYPSTFDKPCLICEYAHSMGNATGNLKEYWDIIEKQPKLIGACIWDWIDQAIYEPSEIKAGTYQGRLRTGYDFPGPHQGNFCCNGLIPATRDVTPKLVEVKAALQNMKFHFVGPGRGQNTAVITLINGYSFQSMLGFSLKWQAVVDGKIVGEKTQRLDNYQPGDSTTFWLKLPGMELKKVEKDGLESFVNISVVRDMPTPWSPAGFEVASTQFNLTPRLPLAPVAYPVNGPKPAVTTDSVANVKAGNTIAHFNLKTGRLTYLKMGSKEIVKNGGGFIYENHRWIENDRYPVIDSAVAVSGSIVYGQKGDTVIVTTSRGSKLCPYGIVYYFYPNGTVEMNVKLTPVRADLRRAGLACNINSELSNVSYYARGPWENYCDRKDGCFIGRYTTTVDSMMEKYQKPQSMGNREDLRELTLTDNAGKGLKISVEGEASFSIQPYTDADLMKAKHTWELEKRPYNVLHLDAWVRGVGNASCGQDVDTLPQYWVPKHQLRYKLRLETLE